MPFDTTLSACVGTDCQLCPVRTCMARRGSADAAAAWSSILAPRMAAMPGAAALHRAGDKMKAVFSVRGGCIKAYTIDADGNERIRGFYLPGDLVGLDGFGGGVCLSTAAAVVPSQVCVVPVCELRKLMQRWPSVSLSLMEQTSRELGVALAMSGDYSAEQRLAAFLLHMRDRLAVGGAMRLPMAQRDVGSYLRLATETVCRTLKSMERRGWLSLSDKNIRILDEAGLHELADVVGIFHAPAGLSKAA
ncbi:MAG: helix-turn-helix domain-containing protein [Nevskia sp.]|nr:helix-turn-helix domain-containing protein [Nevskia sp.]